MSFLRIRVKVKKEQLTLGKTFIIDTDSDEAKSIHSLKVFIHEDDRVASIQESVLDATPVNSHIIKKVFRPVYILAGNKSAPRQGRPAVAPKAEYDRP
jgi:hypothetical protein